MAAYTTALVEKILRNYLDIRATLEGNAQRVHDTYCAVKRPNFDKQRRASRRRAFGQTDERWPFMEPQHAKPPMDGKAKARAMEELHCAAIDLETAFPRLLKDEQELLLKYHVYQTHTLDELTKELGLASRGAMQQRIYRVVRNLAGEMEVCQKPKNTVRR